MAQPNLERLFLKLSQQIQDARVTVLEADTGHDYTKLQLVQALNNAVRDFMNEVCDKEKLDRIAIILAKYAIPVSIPPSIGGSYPLNDNYLRVISVEQIQGVGVVVGDYVDSWADWQGIERAYNSEENDLSTLRWTQFNDTVYAVNVSGNPLTALVIKKHNDIALGDSNDFLIDNRFDSTILKLAKAEIESYSPVV